MLLRPFWRYYGGKWRSAPRYPPPQCPTIVEPFAGAAGYSMRHHERKVILLDAYPVVREVWRFLIAAKASEIRAIPTVRHVEELPASTSCGARNLVGFCMNDGAAVPCKTMSSAQRWQEERGSEIQGWSAVRRDMIAYQVKFIRHWKVVDGDYTSAPDIEATWFIDPPYSTPAGRLYKHNTIDYEALGAWCMSRRGQVIACDGSGAKWAPFSSMGRGRHTMNNVDGIEELLWHRPADRAQSLWDSPRQK